jgi:putative two-component system response regulator
MPASTASMALVVEPDAADRHRLRDYLAADGYEALSVPDARAGLELARRWPPGVVVMDVDLPGREAAALARRIRALPTTRGATIIAVADPTAMDDVVGIMDAGVDDFLARPFGRPELRSRIETASRSRARFFAAEAPDAVLAALANALEANDVATASHSRRVARMAANLGAAVGLTPEDLEAAVTGALLHDVGKIAVPTGLLKKLAPPTPDEWAIMRGHAEAGEAICRPLAMAHRIGPIIRHHHERWDGRGYPDGLAGERIPLGARVVAVVDAFDAMVHDRPYRAPRSRDEAIAEIRDGSGTQFDPSIAELFIRETCPEGVAGTPRTTPALLA